MNSLRYATRRSNSTVRGVGQFGAFCTFAFAALTAGCETPLPLTRPPSTPPTALVAPSSLPFHVILGSDGTQSLADAIIGARKGRGWDGASVAVISDIQVNALRIRQVRMKELGCKAGTRDHLELSGPIGPDSSLVVERVLDTLPVCNESSGTGRLAPTVYLNSPGGQLKHGYMLGLLFRKHRVSARIVGEQQCASACAIAFLGARYRDIEGNGHILFHSPYVANGRETTCPTRDQVPELRQYFVAFLGSKDGELLFDRTMSFCGQQSGWTLNRDAAKLFGITSE
jgi:hypothetical protein